MSSRRESWTDIFRALGQAFFEVARAELEVLQEQWKRWGTKAGIAIALATVAATLLLVYLPGLLTFALIDGLHAAFGWPWWGATLAVAGLVVLVSAIMVGIGWLLLKREENPITATSQRLADHRAWWHDNLLDDSRKLRGETSDED